jgi:hypothetical protein
MEEFMNEICMGIKPELPFKAEIKEIIICNKCSVMNEKKDRCILSCLQMGK